MNTIAHKNGEKTEDLLVHLREVGDMAAVFGKKFGSEKLARVAGNLHDIGKYSNNMGLVMDGLLNRQDHAIISGIYYNNHGDTDVEDKSVKKFVKRYLSLVMACHHSHLYNNDYTELKNLFDENKIAPDKYTYDRNRAVITTDMEEFESICDFVKKNHLDINVKKDDILDVRSMTENAKMFYVRMLESCLVDADYTCTQRFMEGEVPVSKKLDPEALLKKLIAYQADKSASAPESVIKDIRNEVFKYSLKAGEGMVRFCTLTSPTGSAKTLAIMAYGLKQAEVQGADRIFIVLPYLSITDQNSKEYKEIFGKENVLVVDSQTEYDNETRFYAERWDAPIIVTTSVAFFETLFADKATQLRKLHNVANSIVVFDECQTLPSKNLCCTMEILQELARNYNTSILLSTATKPKYQCRNHTALKTETLYGHTWSHLISSMEWNAKEIIPDINDMFDRYDHWKNLHTTWDVDFEHPYTIERLIDFFKNYNQVIYIFNTIKHAKDMYVVLCEKFGKENCFILTSKFCSVDKLMLISEVNKRLKEGKPAYLAATQCVEAGVDSDFPAGAREYAPLDSIIQAMGRVCRSDNHDGDFLVFQYVEHELHDFPSSSYWVASQISMSLAQKIKDINVYDPALMEEYFDMLYTRSDYAHDSNKLYDAISDNCFEKVKDVYKMIPDLQYQVIVLPHNEEEREKAKELMKEIEDRDFTITKAIMKKAGKYTVSVYPSKKYPIDRIASRLFVNIAGKKFETNWFMLREENFEAYGDMGLDDKFMGEPLIS